MWDNAQEHELDFWNQCIRTYVEEGKQLFYATRMKLQFLEYPLTSIDCEGKSILDIGSGPVSLLLKSFDYSKATAVDPLMDKFPQWVRDRYTSVGITPVTLSGEDLDTSWKFDEVWIYNVLQHTKDPELIIHKARRIGKTVRIFEWLEVPADDMHPHVLHEADLDKWFNAKGMTEQINEPYMFKNKCYFGVFSQ